jgi:uncharacterized membrane protein HdeD (DUF308 family)
LTIRLFSNWGWVLVSGLIRVALSLILWAKLPQTAMWLIGLLLGIELISVKAGTRLSRPARARDLTSGIFARRA